MADKICSREKDQHCDGNQNEGNGVREITLDGVLSGEISSADIRISPDALHNQSVIADQANRSALADNLRRAAELTNVPNEEILSIYNALRPHRSTRVELDEICNRLETEYGATTTAQFIRDAIIIYEQKGLIRRR